MGKVGLVTNLNHIKLQNRTKGQQTSDIPHSPGCPVPPTLLTPPPFLCSFVSMAIYVVCSNSINDAVGLRSAPLYAFCLHDRTGKKRSHKMKIKKLTNLETWTVVRHFVGGKLGPVAFAKTSGSVTRYKEENWPIADRRVPSNYPRSNCGAHFGSMQFPSFF